MNENNYCPNGQKVPAYSTPAYPSECVPAMSENYTRDLWEIRRELEEMNRKFDRVIQLLSFLYGRKLGRTDVFDFH